MSKLQRAVTSYLGESEAGVLLLESCGPGGRRGVTVRFSRRAADDLAVRLQFLGFSEEQTGGLRELVVTVRRIGEIDAKLAAMRGAARAYLDDGKRSLRQHLKRSEWIALCEGRAAAQQGGRRLCLDDEEEAGIAALLRAADSVYVPASAACPSGQFDGTPNAFRAARTKVGGGVWHIVPSLATCDAIETRAPARRGGADRRGTWGVYDAKCRPLLTTAAAVRRYLEVYLRASSGAFVSRADFAALTQKMYV